MALTVDDIPAKMTPRRRVIMFTRGKLIFALMAQCRAEGIDISKDCILNVTGLAVGNGEREHVSLVIDGD